MNKTIFRLIILVFLFTKVSGQKFDGYRYIIVEPLVYQNGSIDPFGVITTLQNSFSNYGFILIDRDTKKWSNELRIDQCPILDCQVQHNIGNSVFNPFKVTIVLRNCKNEI